MTRHLTFRAGDRLLVFAPHPDDETLATGELIQLAVAAGATARIVFATDGDNNPWPQRWFERRLRLDEPDRARWGQRRRGEALDAVARLGLDAAATRFLEWPDLGLTRTLLDDAGAIDVLAEEIAGFAPTHVAMPSLRDCHPDHSALRVMLDLALAKTRVRCVRLGYVVHGRGADAGNCLLPRDGARHARKRDALMAHESQIRLSRRRLLRWADQDECFELADADTLGPMHVSADRVLRLPLLPAYRYWRRHELLLLLGNRGGIDRARVRLPQLIRPGDERVLAEGLCSGRVAVELIGSTLQITFAGTADGGDSGYIKIERTWPRLIIFDAQPWQRLEDFPSLRSVDAAQGEPIRIAQRAST